MKIINDTVIGVGILSIFVGIVAFASLVFFTTPTPAIAPDANWCTTQPTAMTQTINFSLMAGLFLVFAGILWLVYFIFVRQYDDDKESKKPEPVCPHCGRKV